MGTRPGRVRGRFRLRTGPHPLAARPRPSWSEGDRDRARTEWETAVAIADRLGAAPLRHALDLLGRRARFVLQDSAEPEAASVLDALTGREREVLAQVAAGRSNREIGERLFISQKTASVHVSNILAKLGAATRTQAAAIAHQEGRDRGRLSPPGSVPHLPPLLLLLLFHSLPPFRNPPPPPAEPPEVCHAGEARLMPSTGSRRWPRSSELMQPPSETRWTQGGWFKETWRSPVMFSPEGYDGPRHSATAIYFLLEPGEESAWHVVASAELWFWHRGGAADPHVRRRR